MTATRIRVWVTALIALVLLPLALTVPSAHAISTIGISDLTLFSGRAGQSQNFSIEVTNDGSAPTGGETVTIQVPQSFPKLTATTAGQNTYMTVHLYVNGNEFTGTEVPLTASQISDRSVTISFGASQSTGVVANSDFETGERLHFTFGSGTDALGTTAPLYADPAAEFVLSSELGSETRTLAVEEGLIFFADFIPASYVVEAATEYELRFQTATYVPGDATIRATFPSVFDVSGVNQVRTTGNWDGSLNISIDGQTVVISRSGGTALPIGTDVSGIYFSNVVNPTAAELSPTYDLTLTNGTANIASSEAVQGETFVGRLIELTSFDERANYNVGASYPVTWSESGAPVSSVDVLFSTNGGASFDTLATDLSPVNAYNWTPTSAHTTSLGKIKVVARDAADNYLSDDISAEAFCVGTGECGDEPATDPDPQTNETTVPDETPDSPLDEDLDVYYPPFSRLPDEYIGTLLKTTSSSTVYFYGSDHKRHPFPNEATYYSYYTNFDNLVILSDWQMAQIQLGGRVTMRPGTNLIKTQANDNVYAVEPGGLIKHIPSEAEALRLFGADWAQRIVDVSVVFWNDYTEAGALSDLPVSAVVNLNGLYYRRTSDGLVRVVPTHFNNARYQDRFVTTPAGSFTTPTFEAGAFPMPGFGVETR